jgi:hypothetical protein
MLKPVFVDTDYSQDSLNGHIIDRRWCQGLCTGDPSVRYVLVVKPVVKYRSQIFSAIDAFLSRFATSPASLAWEKVPFSFVVDWFVDLRGVMRTLDTAVGFEPYQVISFTRSLNYTLETSRFWETYSPCSGGALFNVRVGTAVYRNYERSIVSLGANAPTWKPRLGKNQMAILAALITQQLTKVRAR